MVSDAGEGVLVIGVGGAGGSIADYMRINLGLRAVVVNTDKDGLRQFPEMQQLQIEIDNNNGLKVHNPAQARKAVEHCREKLMALIAQAKTLVIVAGLGGNAGSGAGAAIIEMATKIGKDVVAVVTLPFSVESKSRREVAISSLGLIRSTGAKLIVYDHAAEAMSTKRSCSLNEALAEAAKALSERLKAGINM